MPKLSESINSELFRKMVITELIDGYIIFDTLDEYKIDIL